MNEKALWNTLFSVLTFKKLILKHEKEKQLKVFSQLITGVEPKK